MSKFIAVLLSSGLGVGSINIGERQDGKKCHIRLSVACTDEIDEAMKSTIFDFRSSICMADNVYEYEQTGGNYELERPEKKITQKKFFDLDPY